MKGLVQRWGPTVIGILFAVAAVTIYSLFDIKGEFNEILQAAIVFASITIGFTGVLVSILFSLGNRKAMKDFMGTNEYKLLIKYFKKCVVIGLFLVFISMVLFLRQTYSNLFEIALFIWVFLLAYTFTGFYRIIDIIFSIAFLDDDTENKKPEDIKMDDLDKKGFKASLKIK